MSRSVYDQIARETDPLVGQRIAERYLVIRKLGEGGMGEVYLAEHEDIEKRLALKVLKHEYSTRADVVARFKQEAISASRIKHPNVVDVFDFGQLDDGRFYLAMEWLDGSDLADALATKGTLEPARGVAIAMQMCRALAAAHAKGVVHRDLKPENIFLCVDEVGQEQVKIVDFGIAKLRDVTKEGEQAERRKLTKTGMIFGTPEYMAPEQASGKNVDDKVDIYAMGVILFEMFAGSVPFSGDTFMAVLTAHMTEAVPAIRDFNPSSPISEALEQAIYRALNKKPGLRHESMSAFAQALAQTPEAQTAGVDRLPVIVGTGKKHNIINGLYTNGPTLMPADMAHDAKVPIDTQAGGNSKSKGWIAVGVIGAAVLAGVGVFVLRLDREHEPVWEASTSTSVSLSESPSAPVIAVSSSSGAVVVEEAKTIVLRIESNPSGAVIKKKDGNDLFQVCAAAPCEYPARLDEKVELVAEKASLRGTAAVFARTSQTIVIDLRATGSSRPSPKPTDTSRTNNCEFCVPKGDPDCIKVIRPCDRPPY
ncbi:MAG TPA: serine/threonine-protein kinase [Polyangiaceae bacterium]|nr:serine/threonine-protein kinase [Polyangiaceae bacterium]